MATTIDEYFTLSVTDIKRLGFLKPDTVCKGGISWKRGNRITAQIDVITDTRALPMCYLIYKYGGDTKQEEIRLMFKHSNLDPESKHGYYYFVCPVTGTCCRKLYNVGGQFVGRSAFRALYPNQAQSRKQRKQIDLLATLGALRYMDGGKYRKEFYRGKPTRYRLRLEKYIERNAKRNAIDPFFSRFWAVLQSEL
jgi:hypothetical protein